MTSRIGKPDTAADQELRDILLGGKASNFVMIAGAGSGKTTSLIKALAAVLGDRAAVLRKNAQRIACITYTDNAVEEIWKDVGENPLVHVSTIHSFLWDLVQPFQVDIKEWVGRRIDAKLEEHREKAVNFSARVRQSTRDANQRNIDRYEAQKQSYRANASFTYGKGSDYGDGVLGHNDIITMVPDLILGSTLLRAVLARKYPCLFVDESQDTMANVVAAFKAVARQAGGSFCLGFFGDPMQRIYQTGTGAITLEDGWKEIKKPENFRCPTRVLAVANAIRKPADGLEQTRGRMEEIDGKLQPIPGTARIFVLPADDRRTERLRQVRDYLAEANGDQKWGADSASEDVKVLVIVHRMAARRLGFAELYGALNDRAPDSFSDNFLDASLWPVGPFFSLVLPVVEAARKNDGFSIIQVLREECPLLEKDALKNADVAAILARLNEDVAKLVELVAEDSQATVLDVLKFLQNNRLAALDPRLLGYLDAPVQKKGNSTDGDLGEDGGEAAKEVSAMAAYLACPAVQFWGYRTYVNEESPFSTQQGIKGAEFNRVLTVLDDDEGRHFLFSYNKYLGITPPSAGDLEKIAAGEETQIERTQRLFYVCCTRALQDLAVVLFAADVPAALTHVRAKALFPDEDIILEEGLAKA